MENSSLFSSGNPKRGRGINLLGTTECTTGDTIRKKKKKKKLKKRLQRRVVLFSSRAGKKLHQSKYHLIALAQNVLPL
jgi:hypothetical protein